MAFWNRKQHNVDPLVRAVLDLRADVDKFRREVTQLRSRVEGQEADLNRVKGQPVPTNGQPRAGSAVQDWLPVVDRMQELLLVQMGNADLAQAFGTYSRQRELRASEEPPNTTWTEPDESTYENV